MPNFNTLFSRGWRLLTYSLALVLCLVLLGVYFAPAVAIQVAQSWYAKQGEGYRLQVERWQFSPFTTQLILQGVQLQHGNHTTELKKVALQFNPWALRHQQVEVSEVVLEGLTLAAQVQAEEQQAELALAGIRVPLFTAESEPKEEAANAELSQPWALNVQNIQLRDFDFSWEVAWVAIEPAINTTGRVQLKQLQLHQLSTDDSATTQLALAITLDALALQQFSDETAANNLALNQPVNIAIDGEIRHLFSNPTWQGDITFAPLALTHNGMQVEIAEIKLVETKANTAQQSVQKLQVQGIEYQDLNAQLQVQLADVLVEKMQAQEALIAVDTLELNKLHVNSQQHPLAELESYFISGIELKQQEQGWAVKVTQQGYQGLQANIKRLADGQIMGLADLPSAPQKEQPEAATNEMQETSASEMQLAIVLQELLQSSFPQSALSLEDASIQPKLKTRIELQELSVGKVSTHLQGQNAELLAPVPVHVKLGLGQFGRAVVDANLALEQETDIPLAGNIRLKVRSLNIVDFNGYLIQALGYQLNRGSLDVDATLNIHQGKLKGNVELLLRNAKFVPANEATIEKISKQISMPLDTAIGLLRDKQGNVRLSIPVSGDLNDPHFSFADIVRQLSRKALKSSLLYVLKQSMQPYGGMLSLASWAGEYVFAIRLGALSYVDHQVELTTDQRDNLAKIAALMQNKTALEVSACALVSATEVEALGDEEWPELAKARGQQVKQWFIENAPEQVTERLTLCRVQKGKSAEVVLGVAG